MTTKSYTTVNDADEGDFGWVWLNNDWVIARVNEDMLATYPADYLTQYRPLDDETLALPWAELSRPHHDGYEAELTSVTVSNRGESVTVSMNLPDTAARDELSRKVLAVAYDYAGVKATEVES